MRMNKLLLADNFQLKTKIKLVKTIEIKTAKKAEKGKKKKGTATKPAKKEEAKIEKVLAGKIQIEINLQRGDTEEELERNYHLKLKQQEEIKVREAELAAIEKRKRAVMLLEEQPTFAQLYLFIDKVGPGGILIDRDGKEIAP